MNSLFQFRCNIHNIRSFQKIFTKNRKTVKYGTETATYQSPSLLTNLHTKYKVSKSFHEFKSKIKTWECDFSQCRLCKNMSKT